MGRLARWQAVRVGRPHKRWPPHLHYMPSPCDGPALHSQVIIRFWKVCYSEVPSQFHCTTKINRFMLANISMSPPPPPTSQATPADIYMYVYQLLQMQCHANLMKAFRLLIKLFNTVHKKYGTVNSKSNVYSSPISLFSIVLDLTWVEFFQSQTFFFCQNGYDFNRQSWLYTHL